MSDTFTPPRENLYRSISGVTLERDGGTEDGPPIMRGEFAVFNQWTQINSMWEGNFMESIAPGAFKKTMRENRDGMRVLFQHGRDPFVGDKPLGPITDLRETDTGAAYEVPLLDAPYVREMILPGLEAELYGASFRFQVMREAIDEEPGVSDYNPTGLPERTIKEARVLEFGPVTFGAYSGATAGVRSLTDIFRISEDVTKIDHLLRMVESMTETLANFRENAPPKDGAALTVHPVHGRRDDMPLYGLGRSSGPSWHL